MKLLTVIRDRFHPLWRLRQLRVFRFIQEKLDPDFRCRCEGLSISVKLLRDASVILPHGGKENESRDAFRKAIDDHDIDVFFDIGANVGLYSWGALAKGVKDIFLVEPDMTNQRLLAKTIHRNQLKNCYLLPFAMSDSVGVAKFFLDKASGTTGSLEDQSDNDHSLHHAYGVGEWCSVPTLKLDIFTDFVKDRNVLIKIDVEGAEESVFEGAMNFIQAARPTILVECFDRSRLDVFESMGYIITRLPEEYNYLLQYKEK
ncbi:FkbM family methyltransferase [Rubellicoccus peritrichatus]|uniref:FkbM family methyltransferase n=1 Tax=Rubellicoccus peritrichatus TaxID=3080537 RepID=A0AAQ3QVV9_9BACT|nr:FkbM family methyltransferase [Puniceicoccus sp. CR14]WOO41267.1 FkbM family methyltransferase [Puniceicoccus sp. CR14]